MSSPDFQRYLINTLKLSVYGWLWSSLIPNPAGIPTQPYESKNLLVKVQLCRICPTIISIIVLCGIVRVLLSVTGPVNSLLHTSINFMSLPEAFRLSYMHQRHLGRGADWASIKYPHPFLTPAKI